MVRRRAAFLAVLLAAAGCVPTSPPAATAPARGGTVVIA